MTAIFSIQASLENLECSGQHSHRTRVGIAVGDKHDLVGQRQIVNDVESQIFNCRQLQVSLEHKLAEHATAETPPDIQPVYGLRERGETISLTQFCRTDCT